MPGFVQILLPLPVPGFFTYSVPEELKGQIVPGIRVAVQFGSKKIYAGLVAGMVSAPPEGTIPKPVLSLIDDEPVVNSLQFRFWEWIAGYYLCTEGEVMNAALPAALRLSSTSKVVLRPGTRYDFDNLGEKEQLLVQALEFRKKVPVAEIPAIIGQLKALPVIRTLIDRSIVMMEEELPPQAAGKKELRVELAPGYREDEEKVRHLFDMLEKRAPRQLELLMTWVQMSRFGSGEEVAVKKKALMEKPGMSSGILQKMVEKNIFLLSPLPDHEEEQTDPAAAAGEIGFTAAQQQALAEIHRCFDRKEVVLLHGVTSSGKTEIYIRLIGEALSQGKQVLYLLPEIALTTQIINRLRKYFGSRVGVYHSRFAGSERLDIWKKGYDIVIGARSALFLPYRHLGLVIVDEEHDASFKQMDPSPRYHGRDAAIYLARLHGARTLLGTATPSVETYFNAREGKYGLVELNTRYGNSELPLISVVNVREELRKRTMRSHFSPLLIRHLEEALERGEQSILFQNRRGFSLRLECDACQWMPSCVNCDVTLVYHKKSNQLRCHYCGYMTRVPESCPQCRNNHLSMKGFGPEKVEEELSLMFPGVRIARMDLDTTRSRHAYQQIISDFEEGRIDILVGTQMVTKGLDFGRVSTVCVLNADNMLSFPDFRSAERSFQLMAQVSGRSGRRNRRGDVIIQTYNPDHPVIRDVVNHDFISMYKRQIPERLKFKYPPFYRLVLVKVRHRDFEKTMAAARMLAGMLRTQLGSGVLGPEFPLVSRVMNLHIQHILVKIERNRQVTARKATIRQILDDFRSKPEASGIRVSVDVDPV